LVGEAVAVRGVLCFIEADWPLVDGSFTTRGVHALWPKKLYPVLRRPGPAMVDEVARIHARHSRELRSA
jgi:hypothetical protein